jgi:hypothetical protein
MGKMTQAPASMEYVQFCKAVEIAWRRSHPDIPMMAEGSKNFDNAKTIITFHLQRRQPADNTPKQRAMENVYQTLTRPQISGPDIVEEEAVLTAMMRFENTVVFTIHVPKEQGGGEIADLLCEEFERFMLEHTRLLMQLGADQLRYFRRFYDDSLLKEGSSDSVRRFIAYTLHTQIVTQAKVPVLQQVEAEIRAVFEAENNTSQEETFITKTILAEEES